MSLSEPRTTTGAGSWRIAQAARQALAYADVFDYPLSAVEVHRYLPGMTATLEEVRDVLGGDGPFTLHGRDALLDVRRGRATVAPGAWLEAVRYGRIIARLPFVRMVAVTGALAVDNAERGDDIDYLVVTAPGRLWTCRALTIGVVRWARRRGVELCPNYLISADSLVLDDQTLFTAHELAQMVPISGLDTYWQLRATNDWSARLLPNAAGLPPRPLSQRGRTPRLATWYEVASRGRVGDRLERWEQRRKIRQLQAETEPGGETAFSADRCKGHFEGHGWRTLRAFQERLDGLEAAVP